MSAIVSGLIGGAVAAGLTALAAKTQRPATLDDGGWKRLRPSWLLNGMVIGAASLSALAGWSLATGGSSRPDAAIQNVYAGILALSFAAMAGYVGWSAYGRAVLWRDDRLWVRIGWGRERLRSLDEARSITKGEWSGEYRIVFDDGARLRFSAYLHGATELANEVSRRVDDRNAGRRSRRRHDGSGGGT